MMRVLTFQTNTVSTKRSGLQTLSNDNTMLKLIMPSGVQKDLSRRVECTNRGVNAILGQ